MSWATERSTAGKKPWNWIEIAISRCRRTYGDGVGSPATGCVAQLGVHGDDKCHNSWETCQDRDNFQAGEYWLRFCEPTPDAPRTFTFGGSPEDEGMPFFLPFLRSISHDPASPEPGESMGLRVSFTAQLEDAPHHDIGIDKYALERVSGAAQVGSPVGAGYDPMTRGTFFRKLKARFPHYIGRTLRWYQGYITNSPSIGDFRRRDYVIEKFEGPDAKGRIKIVASDILRLLADDRATCPVKSKGKLTSAMTAVATPTTIDVTTSAFTEYNLTGSPSVGYVRIGSEILTYTGASPLGAPQTGVTLTGVTRTAPFPYSTTAAAHSAGDIVQKCEYLSGTVASVLQTLMVDFGGIPASYIPTSDWTTEATTWAPESISRLITEPEGVTKIINEIIGQTLTWGVWFDEVEQKIKYKALRPADVAETVPTIDDADTIVAGSVDVKDLPAEIVNEVQVLFSQVDPTKKLEDFENYARGHLEANADSQSSNEVGQARIKRVYARWHPSSNVTVVEQLATRTLNARSSKVVEVKFAIERKDEEIGTGGFVDLSTIYLLSALGVPETTRLQVLQVEADGEELSFKGREVVFRSLFGRLGPDGSPGGLEGLLWSSATAAQRERYMFLADSGGTFTNGDQGKGLQ